MNFYQGRIPPLNPPPAGEISPDGCKDAIILTLHYREKGEEVKKMFKSVALVAGTSGEYHLSIIQYPPL